MTFDVLVGGEASSSLWIRFRRGVGNVTPFLGEVSDGSPACGFVMLMMAVDWIMRTECYAWHPRQQRIGLQPVQQFLRAVRNKDVDIFEAVDHFPEHFFPPQ
ncbi:hypothetical protein [Paracoccus alkanivorans]|uniref:hypothetical protein n=1 Tax=Paracoccus alkanivorans TaxID=2116655 RepID=UPI0011C4401E|nr:hypothetical protein [Paracoccus alkanivorans]